MRIAEIYESRQGEGLLTGTPSVFLRTSGCNLRCWFCDTPYTSWEPEGEPRTVPQVLAELLAFSARHVVITGGEPMLYAELVPLCRELRAAGRHITIETAGTLYLDLPCDLLSISPKLANSTPSATLAPRWRARHDATRYAPETLHKLLAQYTYQLKFVIDQPADCDEVERFLEAFPHVQRDRVLLMPQGVDLATLQRTAAWLEPLCAARAVRFCPRKHVEWYGFRRGT